MGNRNTFSIRFFVRESKKNRQGFCHIEMSITLNGRRQFISMPFLVRPEDFNRKRRDKSIDDYIDSQRTRINEILSDMSLHKEGVTIERLRRYISTGGWQCYTIDDLFSEYLDVLRKRIGTDLTVQSYRKYELASGLYREMFDCSTGVEGITQLSVRAYQSEVGKRYKPETAANYLTRLKSFCTYALRTGRLSSDPFVSIKIKKGSRDVVVLSESEVGRLLSAHIPNDSLQRVLDCFIFEMSSGIAYCDMCSLKKEDVKTDADGIHYVTGKRQKTGTQYTSVILPEGMRILEKYDYRLPLLSNQKMNLFLKRIQSYLDIGTTLTTHLGRRTYLSRLLNDYKMRLETVSRIAGHSSLRVTGKYYARIQESTVLKEVSDKLLSR